MIPIIYKKGVFDNEHLLEGLKSAVMLLSAPMSQFISVTFLRPYRCTVEVGMGEQASINPQHLQNQQPKSYPKIPNTTSRGLTLNMSNRTFY